MSEQKAPETPKQQEAAPAPPTSRLELFTKFYTQAYALASSSNEAKGTSESDEKDHQRILITLDTISKLIFGLDEKNKTEFVLHGAGVLELIIALVQKSEKNAKYNQNQTPIQTASLKAIKTCVLRNSAGRSRCRSSGVLSWLNKVLELALNQKDAVLTEEAFTTLAATCLGDDLNALQASCEVKPFIKSSKDLFPPKSFSSMHQKTLYLETLFAAVEKEQTKLLRKIKSSNGTDSFFKSLEEAESNIRIGFTHLMDKKYAMSAKHYNHAMKLLSNFGEDTSLLDDILVEIRSKRLRAEYELGNFENCLQDTMVLLEKKDKEGEVGRANLLKLHGKALMKAGKVQESKETFAKLKLVCPEDDDEEIVKMLNDVKVGDQS